MNNTSVIIISWNEKEEVIRCANSLWESNPEIHTVFVDNGSKDGTNEWLQEIGVEYIYFDEGIQPYGKALNAVLENFGLKDNIVFLWPRYQLGKQCISEIVKVLETDDKMGVVGICSNTGKGEQELWISDISQLETMEQAQSGKKSLYAVGAGGYCFGMKRTLIEEVGLFDETLAYIDLMLDYQLRCTSKGYINRIAKAACAFDWKEGKTRENTLALLKNADRKVLREKWHTNYFNFIANTSIINAITEEEDARFSVLEIGCDMGTNLLGIKSRYQNCEIYGLEINEKAAEIGSKIIDIRLGNIEEENVDFGKKFDYIVFGDVLEHLHNPEKTVQYCRELLNDDGKIVASIPNLMHISVMEQLLKGRFHYTDVGLLDRTHIHLFTLYEIQEMFGVAGYEIECLRGINYPLRNEQSELIRKLVELSADNVTEQMYEAFQYIVVARKQ